MSSVVRLGDFSRLWASLAALDIGVNATAIALPLVAFDIAGPAWVGAVAAASSVGAVVVLLGAGVVVDRLRRRAVMSVCLLVRVATLVTGAVLLGMHALGVGGLLAISLLLGASSATFRSSEVAAVRRVVPEPRWPAAFARNQARSAVGDIAGSASGGALVALAGALPLVVDAALAGLALLGVRSIRSPLGGGGGASGSSVWRDARDGYRFVAASRVLRTVMSAATVVNLVAFWPAFLVLMRVRGVGAGTIGLIGGGVGVMGILGAVASEAILTRLPLRVVLVGAVAIQAAGLIVMGLVGATPVVVIAMLAVIGFSAPYSVASSVIESRATPDEYAGRVAAVGRLSAMVAVPVGQVAGTVLLDVAGASVTFLAFAAPLVVVAAVLGAGPGLRRQPFPHGSRP